MTSESRREITALILKNKENSETTNDYNNSIQEIRNKVTSDKVSREEFLKLNYVISAYKTELQNAAGRTTSEVGLPISTVTYFNDGTNIIQETDSAHLWQGATLALANIFYVPLVENSEKLILDAIRETDSDGTTNLEPIIPDSINSFTQTEVDQFNEKTTLNLLLWAKAAYTSGYSSYSGTELVLASNFGNHLEVTNASNFTVGNYLYFYSGTDFFIGIVENKVIGYDGDPSYIDISLKTSNTYSGTIYFTEKIVAGSQTAKNILLHIVSYWRNLVISQISALQLIPSAEISTADYNQLAYLGTVLTHINNWINLSDTDKFIAGNLDTLVSIYSTRNTNITNRVAYLNSNDRLNQILLDRNEVIKVRLKKRSGTLNTVYREILALKASMDTKETEAKSLAYYKNKFVVKRILDGCTDSKIIYLEESADLAKDDAVYVICDDLQLKEVKTYIKDIVNYQKPSNKDLALEPNYVTVKKVLLSNNISSDFTETLNARIAKQLAD